MYLFPTLYKGSLEKRYKRFFADVVLESGKRVVAHCPNTGTMESCYSVGSTVYLSHHPDKNRKLHYTWQLTETDGGFIGVNTGIANHIVAQAITAGKITELANYNQVSREVKYSNSRIDFLLENHPFLPDCYVEVKNVTLFNNSELLFPDTVTERGLKHLNSLQSLVDKGYRAIIFFLVNRPEGDYFTVAEKKDPLYASALRKYYFSGLEVVVYRVFTSLECCYISHKVPFKL